MTVVKERSQKMNNLLERVPCGTISICIVKECSLDVECSTPRGKRKDILVASS
jgi:hypothetical protein